MSGHDFAEPLASSLRQAAVKLDLTYQAIYRAAKAVPGFGDLVAELTQPRD